MVELYTQLGVKGGMMSKMKNPDEKKLPRNLPTLKPLNYLKEKTLSSSPLKTRSNAGITTHRADSPPKSLRTKESSVSVLKK